MNEMRLVIETELHRGSGAAVLAGTHASEDDLLRRSLTAVIDHHLVRLHEQSEQAVFHMHDKDGDGQIDEMPLELQQVAVVYPGASDEAIIRLYEQYTFDQLLNDASR